MNTPSLDLGFSLSILLVVFYDGKNRLFLYRELKAVEETARGLWNAYADAPDYVDTRSGYPSRSEARTYDETRVAPGVTFIVGYSPEGFKAWIVDRDGARLHEWRAKFSEVFPQPAHLLWQARDLAIAWQGAHLFPNGDVVFNF